MLIMTKPISTRSYLGKISNKMTSKSIILRQYVEEEWVHIVVKGFMVQKQLRKQTQILLQSNKLRHLYLLHQTFSLRRLLQPSSKYYLKLHDNKIREVCYLSSDDGWNTKCLDRKQGAWKYVCAYLAVHFAFLAIHLKHRELLRPPTATDLISTYCWRIHQGWWLTLCDWLHNRWSSFVNLITWRLFQLTLYL